MGFIIATGPAEYLIIGQGFIVDAARGMSPVELDVVEKGTMLEGRWVAGRRLNGDEYGQIVPRRGFGMSRVR